MAAGLGDLSVAVYDFGARRGEMTEIARLRGGHRSGVGAVLFAAWADGHFIMSGGNDKRLCMWALEPSDTGPGVSRGQLLASIDHGEKVNCLTSVENMLYVAGTSSKIGVYEYRCAPTDKI